MNDAGIPHDLLNAAQAAMPADSLQAVRRNALEAFARHGLPGARDEDWKYTNLAPAAKLSNEWLRQVVDAGEITAASADSASEIPAIDAHWLVLRDGVVDEKSMAELQSLAAHGVQISSLAQHPDAIRVDGPFDRLNASLLRDGLHIAVAPGARLDKPLAVLFDDGRTAVSQARLVIDVARDGEIEFIEFHRSQASDGHFANIVAQVNLAAASRAAYTRIQDRDRAHYQVGKLGVRLQRDSVLDYASFDFGAALTRQDVFADIEEPGACVYMHGLYLAGGSQHMDNHTRVDHRVGPASSREVFHGILNGKSRCVFNGKAIVHAGADGSDAEQSNHNLLLSDKVEVDTKPELEIYADDVKCSHGATVGQLDEHALFYMRSRGLDREHAQHMLTRAFAGSILASLPVAAAQTFLEERIDTRLNTLLEEPVS